MAIGDFNFKGVSVLPSKANAKPIVDADAVLPRAITRECFEPIPRKRRKILQAPGLVNLIQLPTRNSFDGLKTS
jgi:hypothetical protein